MPDHQTPLIATIAAGLMLAFILGLIAHRLRVQPLVGYLLAGVAGRALHAGLRGRSRACLRAGRDRRHPADVRRRPAFLPEGPVVGRPHRRAGRHRPDRRRHADGHRALAWALGWSHLAGFVFGLALSVASTVVLVRALQDRHILETARGRIAVGWLVVEDLAMVLALVLLPALATRDGGRRRADSAASCSTSWSRWPRCRRLRGDHADRRPARHPLADALHGAHRLARAVPARRLRHRAGRRLRRGQDVRRVVRARRLLRRHGDGRERPQPAGHRGSDAAARCLRRAVLRLRRHAARTRWCSSRRRSPCWRRSASSWSASRPPPT